MQFCHTILILMLALSVALLQTARAAPVSAKSADMSNMSTSTTEDMSASMADMDCCPHKKPTTQKAIPDCCSSMATCPMNCLGLTGTASLIVFPLLLGSVPLCSASNPLHSQTGTPPFRPPRA